MVHFVWFGNNVTYLTLKSSNIDWPGLKTANDRLDFKMKDFRH